MIAHLVISTSEKKKEDYLNLFIDRNGIKKADIFRFRPEKDTYSIERIRGVVNYLSLSGNLKRLFVFYRFDKATVEAQNTFLKTLEEGQKVNAFFVLFSSSQSALLETIKSRCQLIILKKDDYDKGKISSQATGLITALYNDKTLGFLAREELRALKKEDFNRLMEEILSEFRRKLAGEPTTMTTIINQGIEKITAVNRDNLNPRLAFDNFLIFAHTVISQQ